MEYYPKSFYKKFDDEGHELKFYICDSDRFHCDNCNKKIPKRSLVLSCKECDLDYCKSCLDIDLYKIVFPVDISGVFRGDDDYEQNYKSNIFLNIIKINDGCCDKSLTSKCFRILSDGNLEKIGNQEFKEIKKLEIERIEKELENEHR